EDGSPTFEDLVHAFLPGVAPGSALRELRRHALIQILPDQIVRLRRLTTRPVGLTPANIAHASGDLQRVTSTLLFNLKHADSPRLHVATKELSVLRERLPLLRSLLE